MKMYLKAGILAVIMQMFFVGSIFVGFLMDPLLGLIVVGVYFFIVGTFLIFHFVLHCDSWWVKEDKLTVV
jgi:hypothetical protein